MVCRQPVSRTGRGLSDVCRPNNGRDVKKKLIVGSSGPMPGPTGMPSALRNARHT